MPGDAGLGGDHTVVAELGAAGESSLAHDEAMAADDDVVRDVDEVVDLRALPDDGGAEGGAVDAGVRADFDVVVDDHVASLENFAVPAFVEDVTVAVGADDGAGVDGNPVSNLGARVENGVRKEGHIVADLGVASNVVSAQEHGAGADPDARADDAAGSDVGGGVNLRGRRDARAGVDAKRGFVRRKERGQDAGDGDAGIGHADENLGRRGERAGDEDGGGGAGFGGDEVRFLVGEGEVARTREVGGGETCQRGRGVADDFAPELFGNLCNGEGHGSEGLFAGSAGLAPARVGFGWIARGRNASAVGRG